MQNPQRSFSGRRTTGTKTDTLPRTARSWIFLIIIRAHPAGKLGEGATAVTGAELCERLFQSTPPARGGATADSSSLLGMVVVFQSTPPARGATSLFKVGKTSNALFQSTPPARGATRSSRSPCRRRGYFNPRPPRGGRQMGDWRMVSYVHFNPRPPRGGRRAVGAGRNWRPDYFNPRPPRGGRLHGLVYKLRLLAFQSTPPARGATSHS